MRVYPENAITKRDDGVVLIGAEDCIGCILCIEACPFGVIQFDEEKGVAQKCTLCVERLETAHQLACVTVCLSHCMYAESPTKIAQKIDRSRVWLWYKDTM